MRTNILLYWAFLFCLLLVGCSDDKNPIPPPGPDPELAEGITLTPETFEATAEGKITFKASKSSALYGYTGDVYVHIGVADGIDWMYVPADWNSNIAKCKMTKEEDNVWSITLSSTLREWFGVANGVPLQRIGIVFRSSDGSKKGIESDSFISVSDATFTPGAIENVAKPAGTFEGINISGNSVTLVFYDKDKNGKRNDYAYVIGDFNDWKVSSDYKMKRDDASGCWWTTLTGLDPQKEYGFQYYTGNSTHGAIRLADAYTEKVIDPNDIYIPASTYPGLAEYPSTKTAGIISTFCIAPEEYTWKTTNYITPDQNNLVIYEMLFRDFTTDGNIKGAMEKLDYLEALGVNAIELMPVQEFDGNDSWGYNPCFYFAMDKAYGTKNNYKEFIDECHKRGIAVILDVVYNHATGSHPFAKLYWNAVNNETASNNPWFNVKEPHPYGVFHDFNHESELVRTFVKRNLEFLLTEYKVDGFRFDLTKGFTQKSSTESTAGNYDASRIAILKDYSEAIKVVKPEAYVILEHFAVEREEKELAEAGMQLWRNGSVAYQQSGMGWSEKSAFTTLTTQNTTMPFGGWVGYMESHDEERVSYKQTAHGNWNLKTDLATRMKQLQVNASLFFTVPGPKMIWQFGELGYDISIEENGRTGKKPVKWDYYDNASRKELYDAYSKLVALRTTHKDLFESSVNMDWKVTVSDWDNGRYISLKGLTGKGLVAVGNFTNQTITCPVNFQSTGTWKDYINGGDDIIVTTETSPVSVPAHSFYVFIKQ